MIKEHLKAVMSMNLKIQYSTIMEMKYLTCDEVNSTWAQNQR